MQQATQGTQTAIINNALLFQTQHVELIDRVNKIDLGPIKFKMHYEDGIPIDQLLEMEDLYRKYLVLVGVFPDRTIVPTKFIDKMWHTHILDTAKYREDCLSVFGKFIDHFPYLGLRGEEDRKLLNNSFDDTKSLFLESFGIGISAESSACEGAECGGTACGASNCDGNCAPRVTFRPTM